MELEFDECPGCKQPAVMRVYRYGRYNEYSEALVKCECVTVHRSTSDDAIATWHDKFKDTNGIYGRKLSKLW